MKFTMAIFASVMLVGIAGAFAPADSPPIKPFSINEPGTFKDQAAWQYRTADGKYTNGPAVAGTNETIVMPSPSPPDGGALNAVTLVRHSFDTLGYPMHIGLVEKLFASSYKITIFATSSTGGFGLWRYDYGDPVTNETPITRSSSRQPFKAWGPFHGDAIPIEQAPEQDISAAFDFAKMVLNSITNLPQSQKDLANYGVLFIDDGSTVWVELGPRFAPNEAPHLGCQTQIGRDMVFGFNKKQPDSKGKVGRFLQCF
jgi:hypothetical protein